MELKPCPFCGKKVDLTDPDTLYPTGTRWHDDREIGIRVYHDVAEAKVDDGWCYVLNCGLQSGGCGAAMYADSKQEALEKWNRRIDQ